MNISSDYIVDHYDKISFNNTLNVVRYLDGFKHGVSRYYNASSKLIMECRYIDDELDGIMDVYYDYSSYYKYKSYTYKKGILEGIKYIYREDGSIKYQSIYDT